MKSKSFQKKLSLNKYTVSNLGSNQMGRVIAGKEDIAVASPPSFSIDGSCEYNICNSIAQSICICYTAVTCPTRVAIYCPDEPVSKACVKTV